MHTKVELNSDYLERIRQEHQQIAENINDIFNAREAHLMKLVEERDEQLAQFLMRGEEEFGEVSKTRKKRKKRQENEQEHGHGHSKGRFPQHPLLANNAAQKFDGLPDNETSVPANNEELEDELLKNISEALEDPNNPDLQFQLTNDLKARIELYNRQQLKKSFDSTPKPTAFG